jgi:hypothetical protein
MGGDTEPPKDFGGADDAMDAAATDEGLSIEGGEEARLAEDEGELNSTPDTE